VRFDQLSWHDGPPFVVNAHSSLRVPLLRAWPVARRSSANRKKDDLGQRKMAMTAAGKNRTMIFGPKADGTYVVEFRTAKGES
jgi:hypothetical protein